ncbi:tripartite tricarboxylate transporter substrate binding protein [Acidovorax sp. NCPPB 3859]|nr:MULTISPECIES: tripartite tricarboxylate transporter substrate binding protein [unclassified Acidovorax]MDA8450496.1 tripartite tricarboxylate transporter substrate binding protein [Acidovorax sp. GBBC 3297]MDA8459830.1 tripartite tricarboxylate transporter substrate binding protein [Acidovorax sp. GBBC 3333]MDA8464866.1 tripartite tricarboxylate transporter substrate binding protein [Acidovorax sp. GBBC 3332]MDA8470011.1 tripartite tricarboxylate transporter substrate binding protein [Acidov
MSFLPRLLGGCALLFASAAALAQPADYPTQSIKVIVPFPPGGGTDIVARMVLDKIRASTGWTLVVDNRPGAGGNIGMDAVAKAAPDGYTLGMGQTANLAINPSLYAKMPYDASRAFVPVATVAGQPVVLVVNAASRFKTLADLVAAAKAKPDSLSMASAGNGTVGHLTGELFIRQAGIRTSHIPYKGAGPAATDLLGGQVDYYFATPQTVIPFIKAGKLRALAVSSAKRLPVLPDVPTVAESGYKGFDTSDWKMLVAPAGTPPAVLARWQQEVARALARPDTIATLQAEGSTPMATTPQEAAALIRSEQQRWGEVIRSGNVKLD